MTSQLSWRSFPIVLSAPSGGGKSTLASRLVSLLPSLALSISCTTRAPRAGEVEGTHYYFLSEHDFKKRREAGDFLEWAEVHGHSYGTPMSALKERLANDTDMVLTIDPQGAVSVKKIFPQGVYIFIAPPSWEELRNRLEQRGTDDVKTIEIRLANARQEIEFLSTYDYVVINDDLNEALERLKSIVLAERSRVSRIPTGYLPFLKGV